jgi:hypothetical protein
MGHRRASSPNSEEIRQHLRHRLLPGARCLLPISLSCLLLPVACASTPSEQEQPAPGGDPCAAKELPPCPEECPKTPGEMAGSGCLNEGEKCGNQIGDGCTCRDKKWACYPHAPLGGPGTCNQVCR